MSILFINVSPESSTVPDMQWDIHGIGKEERKGEREEEEKKNIFSFD